MSSQQMMVAAAVVESLNDEGNTFVLPFTAERKVLAVSKLEELATLTVPVMPRSYGREPTARKTSMREILIDVGIQKLLPPTADPSDPTKLALLDQLLELAEQIADHFDPGARYGGAAFVRSDIPDPLYDQVLMKEHSLFQCRVQLTFKRT